MSCLCVLPNYCTTKAGSLACSAFAEEIDGGRENMNYEVFQNPCGESKIALLERKFDLVGSLYGSIHENSEKDHPGKFA
jgi:hypothetical protein